MKTETFKLSTPLKTHSGEISEIVLKEPTAKAFLEHGEPFTMKPQYNGEGAHEGSLFVFDNNKAMMGFLSEMTVPRIDDIILSGMSASDFRIIRYVAANIIFGGVQSKDPTVPSNDS
jgi:hypothetical protein